MNCGTAYERRRQDDRMISVHFVVRREVPKHSKLNSAGRAIRRSDAFARSHPLHTLTHLFDVFWESH